MLLTREGAPRRCFRATGVEDCDAHPLEDRDPLVSLGLVAGEAADLIVVHALLVEGGNREHVAAPSLQPHSKLPQRHFHRGPRGIFALAPARARRVP
jgi:hypothetical protein